MRTRQITSVCTALAATTLIQCEKVSCTASRDTDEKFTACSSAAERGICTNFANVFDAACTALPTSPAAKCIQPAAGQDVFRTLGASMCGS